MPKLNFQIVWEYSPNNTKDNHVQLRDDYGLFINGEFTPSQGASECLPIINPASEAKLTNTFKATSEDIDLAVFSARKAYEGVWARISPRERGKYLYRIASLLQKKEREFSMLETMNTGKPIRAVSGMDLPLAVSHFFYNAGWSDKLEYAYSNQKARAFGVIAQILPSNFPLLMAASVIAPALATGNTVVLKPSKATPLSLIKLAEVFQEAGVPSGVMNIVTGDEETGAILASHHDVDKVSFSGSMEVGSKIRYSASGGKREMNLNLGASGLNVIFDAINIQEATQSIINSIFHKQSFLSRKKETLLVEQNVATEVIESLKGELYKLTVGDPMDRSTDIGTFRSKEQLEKYNLYVSKKKPQVIEIFRKSRDLPEKGFFTSPTLLLSNSDFSVLNDDDEVFGPILTIQTFKKEKDLLENLEKIPHDSGLGLWSKNPKVIERLSSLKTGTVWLNGYNQFNTISSFGSYQKSGIGCSGGVEGLRSYLHV